MISGPSIYLKNLNVNISLLISQGYNLVYNKTYSWPTSSAEILSISDKCISSSVICIGGADSLGNLLLAACGNCQAITATTNLNSPVFISGMWWYFTPGKKSSIKIYWLTSNEINKLQYFKGSSFGFSASYTIVQNVQDTSSYLAQYRLSWVLNGGGGWRLGSLINLGTDNTHFKCILIKWFRFN